jgi:hypothetical protein
LFDICRALVLLQEGRGKYMRTSENPLGPQFRELRKSEVVFYRKSESTDKSARGAIDRCQRR